MAMMARLSGIGKKIAYSILGKPANIAFKKNSYQSKVDEQLQSQNTRRIR